MKLVVNIGKKYFFGILLIGLVLAGIVGVIAYNSAGTGGVPATFGHSVDEIAFGGATIGPLEKVTANQFCNSTGACTTSLGGGTIVNNNGGDGGAIGGKVEIKNPTEPADLILQYSNYQAWWITGDNGKMRMGGNGATRPAGAMVFDTAGNVGIGIGMQTPDARLTVSTGDAAEKQDLFKVKMPSGVGTIFVVNSSGKVGIGMGSPTQSLEVRKDQQTTPTYISVNNQNNVLGIAGILFDGTATWDAQIYNKFSSGWGSDLYYNSQLRHIWQKAGVTKMILDDNGNVGIGTASPLSKLEVNGFTRLLSASYVAPTSGTGLEIGYDTATGGIINSIAHGAQGPVKKPLTLSASTVTFNSPSVLAFGSISVGGNVGLEASGKIKIGTVCFKPMYYIRCASGAPDHIFKIGASEPGLIGTKPAVCEGYELENYTRVLAETTC